MSIILHVSDHSNKHVVQIKCSTLRVCNGSGKGDAHNGKGSNGNMTAKYQDFFILFLNGQVVLRGFWNSILALQLG